MRWLTPDEFQAVAALLTFGAACVAVWATFRAPRLAAEFAETLRRASLREDEDRRLRLWIFSTLMQFRSSITNPQCVAALNLIDVVYINEREVREAWRHFMEAAHEKPFVPEKLIERYRALLEKMARSLGLSANISVADISSSYYPEALGNIDAATNLEAVQKIEAFKQAAMASPQKPRN